MTFEEWYKQSGWTAFDDMSVDIAQEAWEAGIYEALRYKEGVKRAVDTKWLKITSVMHENPSDEYFGKIVKEIINDIR